MQNAGISEKAFDFLHFRDPPWGENQESGEVLESEHSSVSPAACGNEIQWESSGTKIVGISEKAFALKQIREPPLGKFRFPYMAGNSGKALLLSGNQSPPRPPSVVKNWRTFGGSEKSVFAVWKSGPPFGEEKQDYNWGL